MTSQELFYVQVTSGNIDRLYNEHPALEQTTKRYICPSTFENFLRAINPNLWLVEFRNAIDVINEHIEFSREDELDEYPGEDVLNDSKRCMLILANQYCPGDIQELTARAAISDNDVTPCPTIPTDVRAAISDNDVTPCPTIPTDVRAADVIRDNARIAKAYRKMQETQPQALYNALRLAGYLDENNKPICGSEPDKAYMAKKIGNLFDIWNWAEYFATIWEVPKGNMVQLAAKIKEKGNNALNAKRAKFICTLAEAIEDIGINNESAQSLLELAKRNGYTSTK